jgi:hypothetical protein
MAVQVVNLPHHSGMDFGVGIERLSGAPMNQAVNPTPTPPLLAGGSTQSFEVSRVRSTRDLQTSLGIDIEASYGCATFGAGASARFSYLKESQVSSSTLFMTVTATVHHADQSIDNPVLTPPASGVVNQPELFATRYGDMFCRACQRGGLFVGLMRVETFGSTEANKIEAELKGTYGFFSADAKANFKSVIQQSNVSAYCTVYTEGGPNIRINDPSDPAELLTNANQWKEAMYSDPDRYSVPYQWTLSPLTIAEGPLPLNPADIQHCQDILIFCARERTSRLDQLNLLSWTYEHPERFDWTGSASENDLINASRNVQTDLDLVASCASWSINNPAQAEYPAGYATKEGTIYPLAVMPSPLPKQLEKPNVPPVPDHFSRWQRFQLEPPGSASATSSLTAVSRAPNTMETWWLAADQGSVQGASWSEGGQWSRYTVGPVYESGAPAQNSGTASLSWRPDRLYMWFVGANGWIQWNWWTADRGWNRGVNMTFQDAAARDTHIAATSRFTNHWEVWFVAPDGSVQGVYFYGSDFGRYTLAPPGQASAAGGMAGLSRKPSCLDVWWIGSGGAVRGGMWSDGDQWRVYEVGSDGSASPQSGIAAVTRLPDRAEVFWISPNGSVRGALRSEGGTWQPYEVAPAGSATPNRSLAAVARATNTVEVWWIGPQSTVKGATWTEGDRWRLYELAPDGSASAQSGIAAVSRIPNSMEIFWVGPDGSIQDANWYV